MTERGYRSYETINNASILVILAYIFSLMALLFYAYKKI